jgi:hypothetical protein
MRPTPLSLLLCSALPLSGCCSLSRLFCGPDDSPWISQRLDTPQRTVQTFFEAIRRDEPEAIWLCLGESYRRRLGLDSMTLRLAWERIRDQNPGLHVAGYTQVAVPRLVGEDRAAVTVDVVGTLVDIDLERQAYWEVRYRREDGTAGEHGAPIESFAPFARVELAGPMGADESRLSFEPIVFRHDGVDRVPLSAIEQAGLSRVWKISDIRQRAD